MLVFHITIGRREAICMWTNWADGQATTVESIEPVKAEGPVVELSIGDELRAARVGVGALGVVAAYMLRTVP